ncbi:hypothetical protein YC2023_089289 [Brassica napus]
MKENCHLNFGELSSNIESHTASKHQEILGCISCSSSSLLSPTRRLRSEAVTATVSLLLKETPSLDNSNKPIERKTGGCSLKAEHKLSTFGNNKKKHRRVFMEQRQQHREENLKRLAEENKEESCLSRVKSQRSQTGDDDHNRGFCILEIYLYPPTQTYYKNHVSNTIQCQRIMIINGSPPPIKISDNPVPLNLSENS